MFAKVPNALEGHLSWRDNHILVSRKCISGYVYQWLETIGFMHRYLWQNLSVKLNILLQQPMHEVPIIDLHIKAKTVWQRKFQKIAHTQTACLKHERSHGSINMRENLHIRDAASIIHTHGIRFVNSTMEIHWSLKLILYCDDWFCYIYSHGPYIEL
jgi:hypothetical protein